MVRLATVLIVSAALASPGWAQITTTPGPGGIPIAPGAPPQGYTPGGVGIGGSRIAPGPAARDLPMYRRGPGGVPVLVRPEHAAGAGREGAGGAASLAPCPHHACLPGGLSLTIDSRTVPREAAAGVAITTLHALGAALRACWTPPTRQRRNVQMTVRFSFRRSGELLGPPFVTYATRGVNARTRQDFRATITAALDRCAPFKLAPEFAAAIAGQPISARFVDHRNSR